VGNDVGVVTIVCLTVESIYLSVQIILPMKMVSQDPTHPLGRNSIVSSQTYRLNFKTTFRTELKHVLLLLQLKIC
jgi:hypothetical protein